MTEQFDRRILRTGQYPELTWTALIVGYGLGTLSTISIGYASLILGFSIEGSELAAILGFGIPRGILGRGRIVENNINQTIASGANAFLEKSHGEFAAALHLPRNTHGQTA